MFGGQGVYYDDVMFALIADGEIFLKADQPAQTVFRDAGSRQFVFEKKGKPVVMSFWRLPDEALDAPDAVARWSTIAVDAARRARAAARKPG